MREPQQPDAAPAKSTAENPGAAPADTSGAAPSEALPRRFYLLLAAFTLGGWGLMGLGLYALTQAWQAWRAVFLAEAVMPLLLGGALAIFTTRAWISLARQWRRDRR